MYREREIMYDIYIYIYIYFMYIKYKHQKAHQLARILAETASGTATPRYMWPYVASCRPRFPLNDLLYFSVVVVLVVVVLVVVVVILILILILTLMT